MANTLYIDLKFVSLISNRLRNWLHKGNGKSAFSHHCERHDSNKRRAYFLPFKGRIVMKCHHCGVSTSIGNFIKEIDPTLYSEYKLEVFRETNGIGATTETPKPVNSNPTPIIAELDGLIPFKTLARTNPARTYLERRALPADKIDLFYLAPKFFKWASKYESSFKNFKVDHPRMVLPFYSADKKLIGFICRAFGKEDRKYIQIRVDKTAEYIYGLDKVDLSKPIIVVEGQIDSLFLDNCIAAGSANYNLDFVLKHDNVIIVPDNDFRRNVQVCDQLKSIVKKGKTISLLPSHWKKDINDIIKKDKISKEELMEYILSHRKSGAEALLEIALEKKC
jgi:DNA primase